ncbi:DUF6504 family protein [Nocardioides sp.]|uniref:DUF6504 family protein n=1 Tax=Nocardioides sp. TaxID=35761 RepID=UPI003568AC1C
MRRYDDPVEVRRGPVDAGSESDAPSQFLWRGRLWKVRSVLAHWVETSPWWNSPGAQAAIGTDSGPGSTCEPQSLGELLTERELWRVEAGRGSAVGLGPDGEPDGGGVFDLAFDWADGRWQLVGCLD